MADLNVDGLEEILVFDYIYAVGGTLGGGSISIMSRTEPNGLIKLEPWDWLDAQLPPVHSPLSPLSEPLNGPSKTHYACVIDAERSPFGQSAKSVAADRASLGPPAALPLEGLANDPQGPDGLITQSGSVTSEHGRWDVRAFDFEHRTGLALPEEA
jgi:hypothetical protein